MRTILQTLRRRLEPCDALHFDELLALNSAADVMRLPGDDSRVSACLNEAHERIHIARERWNWSGVSW